MAGSVGGRVALTVHSLAAVIAHRIAVDRTALVRGVVLEDPPLYAATRGDERGESPIVNMFRLMQHVLTDMQGRGAPLEEYEAMVRAAIVCELFGLQPSDEEVVAETLTTEQAAERKAQA